MDVYRFALRNISGNSFRCIGVVFCASITSALLLASSLILLGAEESLRMASHRFGADIVAISESSASQVEAALLFGRATEAWIPAETIGRAASIPGVRTVSYQIHLATLKNASWCTVSNLFLMVFDPASDFVVAPWLAKKFESGLRHGEAVGGSDVFVPAGEKNIKVYGYPISLRASMEPTGTGLDNSLFLTLETAQTIARESVARAEAPLTLPEGKVTTVLIQVRPGFRAGSVAKRISAAFPGLKALPGPELFRVQRAGLNGLLSKMTLRAPAPE
jgi:putative ABC transport system permease protein